MEWKTFQIVSNLWYSSVIALSSVYLSICTIVSITLYATTTRVMFVTETVYILILLTLIKPTDAISPKFITCTTLDQMLGFKPKIDSTVLYFYFESTLVLHQEEIYQVTLASFLGSIGGSLSLFVGFSLYTYFSECANLIFKHMFEI